MNEQALPFIVLHDIDQHFDLIEFALTPRKNDSNRTLDVVMYGVRRLALRFTGVIAIRHEDECPGFDPLPTDLPKLSGQIWTYPLLIIQNSTWSEQWNFIHQERQHFALISSDDLLQVVASPEVEAHWLEPGA